LSKSVVLTTRSGRTIRPRDYNPMASRKAALEMFWIFLVGEGERRGVKEERNGVAGWRVEGYFSRWLSLLWPELGSDDVRRLRDWMTNHGDKHNIFTRVGDSDQPASGGSRVRPGIWWVADELDIDEVEEYNSSFSNVENPKKVVPVAAVGMRVAGAQTLRLQEEIATRDKQIAKLEGDLAELEAVREAEIAREKQASERANARVEALRAQVAVSANRIAAREEVLAQAPQKAEIEQASIDGINADLRDQTIAQRRELESLRGSLASATEALADRDATIQALDDKLALTQEKFVALKTGQHSDCVPEDLFRNVERENRELDRRISLLKKHLDLAWEVFEG
jgi:hypothetical protein